MSEVDGKESVLTQDPIILSQAVAKLGLDGSVIDCRKELENVPLQGDSTSILSADDSSTAGTELGFSTLESGRSSGSAVVKLVGVIGFHHNKGHTVEWTYPPSPGVNFRHLAMLCLPEGAHHVTGLGHVFFTVDLALDGEEQCTQYFGVSVFGHVKTSELREREQDDKRSHVQKAVMLLARDPCFGWMLEEMRPAVQEFFSLRDFSKKDILTELYFQTRCQPSAHWIDSMESFLGLSPISLVRRFGRNLVMLYKLLLLEPKMILYAEKCSDSSSLVLSLVSLVPRLLQSLSPTLQVASCLSEISSAEDRTPLESLKSNVSEVEGSLKGLKLSSRVNTQDFSEGKSLSFDGSQGSSSSLRSNVHASSSSKTPISLQIDVPKTEDDELFSRETSRMHGLPLCVFHRNCRLEPYIPMELLMTSSHHCEGSFVAGSSNRFLISNQVSSSKVDVVANAETGNITFYSEELKKVSQLSAHERQFADELTAKVEQFSKLLLEGEEGEDENWPRALEEEVSFWIRKQFLVFTLRLLQAASRNVQSTMYRVDSIQRELAESEMPRIHGSAWTDAWRETNNFNRWLAEHEHEISTHSKPPTSPAVIAFMKDGLKSSLLDFRYSLRQSVGAKGGIRRAMKTRLSSGFLSMFSHSGGSTPTSSPEKCGRQEEERKAQGSGHEGLPRVCLLEAFGSLEEFTKHEVTADCDLSSCSPGEFSLIRGHCQSLPSSRSQSPFRSISQYL
uniref:AVL9/DENND6 domain-containing protein n=1 Tax=Hanusia phi TaxID=3032 RepID=A0A7S0I329_9CRYP|mmetsp:Transcript_8826/g.20076  ORF Transcript_8826/g.20076 Transcript_8826/m.20076 type:complete len:732 (+) Transcript_8826:406-2601(+)